MIRIAIIGFGKIARDQHLPAIRADPRFDLVAVSTRSGDPQVGVPWFADPHDMFADRAGAIDAVAICTPPSVRHAVARDAIAAGVSVLLEKPPATTLGEIDDIEALARARGVCLYTGWHSQHAPAVGAARELLASRTVSRLDVAWCESVRKWHPGQDWVWEPDGFGVFDPGINALSILTSILPMPLLVRAAQFEIPVNRQAPIAARLDFAGGPFTARFDWRHEDGEEWTIAVETKDGLRLALHDGGARLSVDGVEQRVAQHGEYPSIYARFAALFQAGEIEVDREPLRIAADAFLLARRDFTAPFMWTDEG